VHKNVGQIDRIARTTGAVALIAIAAVVGFGSIGGVVALVLAGVLVVTAAVGFCPLYRVLHLDTDRS
jgi:hypothetical protein